MSRTNPAWEQFLVRKRAQFGDGFVPPTDERFIKYFDTNVRIRVRDLGMVATGTVSISTGWAPVFLLIRTRRSIGSWFTLGERTELLAVKHGREYVEV